MALRTPAELTSLRWYKADAMSLTDDDLVSSWTDLSSNADPAVQATDTKKPRFKTSVLNGLPVMRFDGGDYLEFGEILDSLSSTASIFVIAQRTGGTEGALLSTRPTSLSTGWTLRLNTGTAGLYFHTGKTPNISFTTIDAQFNLIEVVRNGASITAGVNGTWASPVTLSGYNSSAYNKTSLGAENQGSSSLLVGDIAEILVLPYVADTDTYQWIEGYIMHRYGLQANLPSGHPYKDTPPTTADIYTVSLDQPYAIIADTLGISSEQLYGIAADLGVSLEQLYSILLEVWLTQHYGDMPWLERSLYQPYGGSAILQRELLQRWGSALEINLDLEQAWSLAETLQLHSVQGYGIAAEVLQLTSEQLYQINELTQLFTGLSQPYAIAGEAARLYSLTTKLFIDDERFPYHQLEWQATITEYAWYCAFSTKSQAAAIRCVDGAAIRIEHMGETFLLKCYGGWLLDRRHAEDVYRIEGWSRTRDLDLATPLLGDIPGGMASQLVADLAAPFGIAVDWQMADGYIPAGKLAANNQTPFAMIAEIVHDAEGIIQSTPDGNLLIVAAEETAVPDYPTVDPAVTINARLERISTSEQKDEQKGYNRFVVSDQVAGGDRFNLEYEPIDAGAREIRLFIVPIAGRQFVLTHSSGTEVGIEPFGLASLSITDELVEFKAGVGQTAKPLYGISAMAWQKANLGAITFSEDGVLTAAVAGYSLLKISYVSRYHKWIGRSPNIEDIQFIAHEVTP